MERRRMKREVGGFEVGWSQLNETEEKKELQSVCVCVCVCVGVSVGAGKRAPNQIKKDLCKNLETQL